MNDRDEVFPTVEVKVRLPESDLERLKKIYQSSIVDGTLDEEDEPFEEFLSWPICIYLDTNLEAVRGIEERINKIKNKLGLLKKVEEDLDDLNRYVYENIHFS